LNIDRKSVRDQCVLFSKLFASLSHARSAIISFSHLISTRHVVVISLPRKQVSSPRANRKRKPDCDAGNETLSRRRIIENIRTVLQRGGSDRWIRWVKRETARRAVRNTSLLSSSEVASRHPSLLATSPPTSQYSSQLYTEAHAQLPRNLR